MLGNDILAFIRPEMLVLIPVLIILGLMLKKATYIEDWTIPIILGGIGIILAILILGFAEDFTASDISSWDGSICPSAHNTKYKKKNRGQ